MKLFALGILFSVNAMFNSIAVKGQDMAPTIQKILADTSLSVEEKLVALALNGPYYAGTEYQNKIVGYQLKGAKNSWLNILSLSFNYNNQAISNPNLPNTSLFPKFFFGMTVPLGLVFSRTEVKAAKAQVEMSKNNQEQQKRNISAEILAQYQKYKNLWDLITLQGELINDVQATFIQAEKKFKDGSISIESYNSASKAKNEETARLLNLQLQQSLLKIELEKVIGVPLELVLVK